MSDPTFHLLTGKSLGLVSDAELVASALTGYFGVAVKKLRTRNLRLPLSQLAVRFQRLLFHRRQIGIFFENLYPSWIDTLDESILVPNQEWMTPTTLNNLKKCRQIWCKTRYAQDIFGSRDLDAKYIGFSSRDRYMPNVEKDYSAFLHIQGKSLQKGTESLLNIWSIHPEWPKLTVLTRFRDSRWHQAQNIEIITDYLTEAEMNRLMNSIGVHICTAETEGFGHSLNEALSTKAVTVTTDAPPMNELVSCEFGILVKYLSVEQRGLSEWFGIDPMDLERKIEIIIRTGETAKTEMGELARSSYLAKDREFRERILGAARDLLF